MKLLIIGAGELGRAVSAVLRKNKNLSICFWDKDESKIPGEKPLPENVADSDIIFLCIPSWSIRPVLSSIVPELPKKTVIVSFAKGVEAESMQTMDEVCASVLPDGQSWVVCGGPMIAEELAAGMPARGILTCKDKNIFSAIADIFSGTSVQLEYSDDVRGVAWAGVLKNIYALALGVADGLGWGRNQKSWLVTVALREMLEIIRIFRGKKETVLGLAGLGDLIATGFSNYSRNREVGELLALERPHGLAGGKNNDLQSEGMAAIGTVIKLFSGDVGHYPILNGLQKIVSGSGEARQIFVEMIN